MEHLRIAEQNRDTLTQFFGVLKSGELAPILRFVFLTGISRFSKVSIFSELNNLIDISMDRSYADILGYTQTELERSFGEYLARFAQTQSWPRERALEALNVYYDGYRFTENGIRMYNPFSILRALRAQELEPYWFEIATPSFLNADAYQASHKRLILIGVNFATEPERDGVENPPPSAGTYDDRFFTKSYSDRHYILLKSEY